ncbi:MAG: hypothetical protein CML56_04515 [Rhodobacteraceae bacterium]|nr:hypothetical protein [Paracoccaceae bacterium]
MKTGDLVKVDGYLYPRLKGKIGMLVEKAPLRFNVQWIVSIAGRPHPFYIGEEDMEVISESR